jgi:hypothetical protein
LPIPSFANVANSNKQIHACQKASASQKDRIQRNQNMSKIAFGIVD